MFLPVSRSDMKARGWSQLDVILVSGDAYVDSSYSGTAVIGRVLEREGFRVGILPQPDPESETDFLRFGSPRLFWGVTAGCVDSLVANTTASKKRRRSDDFTPGGHNTRRPDRASIVYANAIRRHAGRTAPLVLGGIEASLRRVAHYDYWTDRIRRSILFDAKAEYLLYGMAENSVTALARALDAGQDPRGIRGLCYIDAVARTDFVSLPSFEDCARDPIVFSEMFRRFAEEADPVVGRGLTQAHGSRFLIQNPPALLPTSQELDAIHELPFENDAHPMHRREGPVRALDTIRWSLTTHRGCYGDCTFCAISVHQGKHIVSRSAESIVREAASFARHPRFPGTIRDVGGPTANMYGIDCTRKKSLGSCVDRDCMVRSLCRALPVNHAPQIDLLRRLRALPGVDRVLIASGIRHDLILEDQHAGRAYLDEIVRHHVGGQMKIAPEHVSPSVLRLMKKPDASTLVDFKQAFDDAVSRADTPVFLTYYFIAAHPGCTEEDMDEVRRLATSTLRIHPEQVQIFTPLPSTWAAVMYHTGRDPFTDTPVFVERSISGKERQKARVTEKRSMYPKSTHQKRGQSPGARRG